MRPEDSANENVMRDGQQYDPHDQGPLPEDNSGYLAENQKELGTSVEDLDQGTQEFMKLAQLFHRESTTYLENSIMPTWEKSIDNFRGKHPQGSKYHSSEYKARSKLFRPKTRTNIKAHEASFAAAAFTNQDLAAIKAKNPDDPRQAAAAKMMQQAVQHRMKTSLHWVLTALGAWQDTHVYGVCASRQEWEYRVWEESTYELTGDLDTDGTPMGVKNTSNRVLADEPVCVLLAPENLRFNINADWRDPVNTSNFVIEEIPMIAADVLEFMESIDPKTGQPAWFPYTLEQIAGAGSSVGTTTDAVRRSREGEDRTEAADAHNLNEGSLVWIHMNVINHKGEDFIFWSIADDLPLTDPVPLLEIYPLGRPWTLGISNVEAHRMYPTSSAEQGESLQEGINDVTNSRFDNVKLAMNKRYFIRRQKQGAIDFTALMRNTPGGGVMVDDPERDVKVIDTRDVTQSSYAEQDRFSVEYDDLTGNMSQGSVLGNRALNETVGGMNIMSSGANGVQELSILVFLETWMVPTIRQIVSLIQLYETEETLQALLGERKPEFDEMRGDASLTDLLREDLVVDVNVGMGHTNPAQKVEKMSLALNTLANIPGVLERLKSDEIAKEVFGYVGHADGARFLMSETEMADMAEGQEPVEDPMIALRREELQLKREQMELDREHLSADISVKRDLGMAQLAMKENLSMAQLEAQLFKDRRKDQTVRDMAAVREGNKARELELKATLGTGI